MQFRARWGGMILLAGACVAASVYGSDTSQPRRYAVVAARTVHGMAPDEATRGYPVHLHAVLTYYDPYIDPRRGAIFVCDGSGCVFVSVPTRPILALKSGDLVDITGVTGPGDYASIVEAADIRVVGRSRLPTPYNVSTEDLLSGAYDCDWVEVRGSVRSVHVEANIVALEIWANGRSLPASTVREPGANYDALLDSQVSVTANTAPVFNSRRQMVGAHVFFPTLRQIHVIRGAPSDPFALPAMPISDLFRVSKGREMSHRVHMQGVLTLDWPGQMICIQSGEDGLCAETRQKTTVPLGTRVEVVGFPAIQSFKPTLEDARFHVNSGADPRESAARIADSQPLSDGFDGRLVDFDAELIGQDLAAAEPTLMLRRGGVIIPALIPREALAGRGSPWKDGSLLRVTGICNLQVDAWSIRRGNAIVHPESARILLRYADDIRVLHSPSWWTAEHTLLCFGVVCVVIFGAFAWILILRHSVKQRTRALRHSEERLRYLSEHDALTGLPNRNLFNERLHMALKIADRSENRLGLLMADVDGFKAVNDKLGHHAGDRLLCELAQRLSQSVRLTDTVARIGGDEFLILLPDLHNLREAELVATKIVSAVASPMTLDGMVAEVTVSVGVVTYPEGGTDAQTLMRHADEAMYAAKSEGKNSSRSFLATPAIPKGDPDQKDDCRQDALQPQPHFHLPAS